MGWTNLDMNGHARALGLCLILGGTASAASLPTQNLGTKKFTTFSLSQNADLWFFNGATPSNYLIDVPLVAAGPQTGTFGWQVTANPNSVKFDNDSNSISKPTPSVQMKSAGISLVPDDVRITFSYNGAPVGIYKTTVFAPGDVVQTGFTHSPGGDSFGTGFVSVYTYDVLDEFGNQIPRALEMNEIFVTELLVNDEPNTWVLGPLVGETNTSITDTYFQFTRSFKFPDPIAPLTPLGIRRIFAVPQRYSAGSTSPGVGRQIRFHTVDWYQDHAFVPVQ